MESIDLVFILISLVALAWLISISRKNIWLLSLFILWTVLSGLLSYFGFFEVTSDFPPRFVWIILPVFFIIWVATNRIQANDINTKLLTSIHVLRIPVELILYQLFLDGLVPEIMTFKGWDRDILSGISAVLILLFFWTKPIPSKLMKVWNAISLILLIIIVSTAVLSAPTPIQKFAFDQPNLAVLRFPYTWLPAAVVPLILLSHILIFKKLKDQSN